MTRVVVVGPYPPAADPVADTVLATVRDLRAAGATVVVASPRPSAAPLTADPTTRTGAARLAPVVAGADRVVWFAPPAARPHRRLRRRLDGVELTVHPVAAPGPSGPGLAGRARRLRAGAPTWVRGVRRRRAAR